MKIKHILFLSTNNVWGGSEVLWTQMALLLKKQGFIVKAALLYDYVIVNKFITDASDYTDLRQTPPTPSLLLRVLIKLKLKKKKSKNSLEQLLTMSAPDIVCISQGNNIDGITFMKTCAQNKIPFITITHLVSEYFWPFINDQLIDVMNTLYGYSKKNYFVSAGTWALHNKITASVIPNSSVISNPFIKKNNAEMAYPALQEGNYRVALIGRIEIYHKGYDLLLTVIKQKKWTERNIQFSIFGSGPHVKLLNRLISLEAVNNLAVHNHIEDISLIWKSHHILLMPSRMEGQSLTLIEALHFQRPVIVTDVGGTNELVNEGYNGFLAAHPTPNAIDEAMERAWQRRNEWEQIGMNGKELIKGKYHSDPLEYLYKDMVEIIDTTYKY